jgi:hypothetical protein
MSIFNDKALKGVAEAAAKIMAETSHGSHPKTPKEKSLAALAHPKDKITHKDVLVGRGVLKKEDVEQLDEVGDTPAGRKALGSYVSKAIADKTKDRAKGLRKATSRMYKDDYYGKKTNEEVELNEETEQLQEYESKGGVYKHKGTYGSSYKTDEEGDEKKSKKGKTLGARQDFIRSTRENEKPGEYKKTEGAYKKESDKAKKTRAKNYDSMAKYISANESLSFTEMLELYNEHGLKVLAPIETEEMNIDGTTIEVIDADKVNGVVETIVEEPTNDEFTKEYEDQKASFEGKKKQPKVAAGKTTGVKAMPESVELDEEQLDELSKATLGSYAQKASSSMVANALHSGYVRGSDTGHNLAVGKKGKQKDNSKLASKSHTEMKKREAGLGKAISRLAKEEVELDERTLTSGEAKKKEDYVMGMKKKLSGFKQRYGERAKSVMYATATKMAKKD